MPIPESGLFSDIQVLKKSATALKVACLDPVFDKLNSFYLRVGFANGAKELCAARVNTSIERPLVFSWDKIANGHNFAPPSLVTRHWFLKLT